MANLLDIECEACGDDFSVREDRVPLNKLCASCAASLIGDCGWTQAEMDQQAAHSDRIEKLLLGKD